MMIKPILSFASFTDTPTACCSAKHAYASEILKPWVVALQVRMGEEGDRDDRHGRGTLLLTRNKTKKPNLYRVLLLNDDYTPMEFVVHVLERFFNKSIEEATEIMLHVHQNGVGQCGVFTYEVAETKVTMVMDFARKHQHPLQCVMEKS